MIRKIKILTKCKTATAEMKIWCGGLLGIFNISCSAKEIKTRMITDQDDDEQPNSNRTVGDL